MVYRIRFVIFNELLSNKFTISFIRQRLFLKILQRPFVQSLWQLREMLKNQFANKYWLVRSLLEAWKSVHKRKRIETVFLSLKRNDHRRSQKSKDNFMACWIPGDLKQLSFEDTLLKENMASPWQHYCGFSLVPLSSLLNSLFRGPSSLWDTGWTPAF